MKKTLFVWQFAGFLFTVTAGTILHFVYMLSGSSPFIAAFSAVNESTWEHMKLLYFPTFLFALVESRVLKGCYPRFWCVKLAGSLLGLALIPGIFYTAIGSFGESPTWLNILLFFVAAAAQYLLEIHMLDSVRVVHALPDAAEPAGCPCRCCSPRGALLALWLILLAFVLFTFFPPYIPLFRDPVSGGYGIIPAYS